MGTTRARMYDPGTGRFLSRDTVQPNAPGTQGFNPYTYVANNPTTWTDPTGHTAAGWSAAGLALALAPMLVLLTQYAAAGNTVAGFAVLAGTTTIGTPALALLGLTLGALVFFCFNDGPCSELLLELLGAAGAAGGGVLERIKPIVEIGHDPTPTPPGPARPTIWQVVSIGASLLLGGLLLGGDTDKRPQAHRGRIQIQGNDMKPETSWPWAQAEPMTKIKATNGLTALYEELSARQKRRRTIAYEQALRYIQRTTYEVVVRDLKKSFLNPGQRDTRIDIEIQKGIAFV